MIVTIKGISYYIDRGLLLDDIELTISESDRIGIVGRNGSGKSCLLNILAGDASIDSGDRIVAKGARILLVKQEIPSDDTLTPLDYLRERDTQIHELYEEAQSSSPEMMEVLYDYVTNLERERYDIAAPKILTGLGISREEQNSPIKNLSGGLRMRISLAAALVQSPDLLLLDEPTNHLDLPSVLWLTSFLSTYTCPFVIVSHDRTLLNALVNKIYHLQQGNLTCYNGNFDTFLAEYALKKEQAIIVNTNMDKKHEKAKEFIAKHKADPKWKGITQTRERLIAKDNAERPKIINEDPPIPIHFPECSSLTNPILEFQQAFVGYDKNHIILKNLNVFVQSDSRIGILGFNGQGKSTLAKVITGHLETQSGVMITNPRLRIGYFSQEQTDVLNPELSVYEQLASVLNNPSDAEIRESLAHFGFKKEQVTCKVSDLSGGEKTRLLLAVIASQRPNLIIMDEPTNHLDFETKETLIAAINKFNGAIVLISHDWDLLAKTMQTYWLVDKGKALPYTKGLEAYKHSLSASSKNQRHHSSHSVVSNMSGFSLLVKRDNNSKGKEKEDKNNKTINSDRCHKTHPKRGYKKGH